MSDGIPIRYEATPVGTIQVGEAGPSFTYDPAWATLRGAFPVSLQMPLGSAGAPPSILAPWLMNLLPEGAPLVAVGRTLGVSPEDAIGILQRMGRDTAGALRIGAEAHPGAPALQPVPDDAALERIIEELPARPFLASEEGVSMSLAGAQEKLPVGLADGRIAIPLNGAPSTHILKPDNKQLYGSVQNEALCLVLARRAGLRAATVTTGAAGSRSYLLVTRYDRVQVDGQWRRLHQEDFCQALGKPPGAKYEHNQTGVRGPGLKDFFDLARQHMTAADTIALLDAVALNVLLTNVDAHAKNYSVLLTGRGARLAPLYDLMCGDAWPNITPNMAQDIGGKSRGAHIHGRHWRRMAATCGLSGVGVMRRVASLARKVGAEASAAADEVRAMPAGDHPLLASFVQAIQERCRTVARNLDQDGPGGPEDDGLAPEEAGPSPRPLVST